MIHVGHYKLFKKRVGYRIDYCDTCKDYTQCDAIRYLLVIHVSFIPLLPLGLYRDWACHTCTNPPRQVDTAAEILAGILGLALFGGISLGTLFFWLKNQMRSGFSSWSAPGFLIAAFLSGLVAGYVLFRTRKALNYRKTTRELRKPAQAYRMETCLNCGGDLKSEPRLHCPQCGMKVY